MPHEGEILPEVSMTTLGLLAAVMASPGNTAGELFSATTNLFENHGVNAKQVVQSLKRARQRGWVDTKGTGRKGDPHRFTLSSDGVVATRQLVARYRTFGAQLNALVGEPIIRNMSNGPQAHDVDAPGSYARDNGVSTRADAVAS